MSGYEEYTLAELSQVFTEETHAPLAASDMRDWLIALGAALGKKRLADKANAWSIGALWLVNVLLTLAS